MTTRTPIYVHFEVPFHDVDRANIVWHGHYLRYFEFARTALMRAHRLDVDDFIDLGLGLVVSESRCRHVSPARYADVLRIEARFEAVTHQIVVGYLIVNETSGKVVARGRTSMVCVNFDLDLLPKVPAEILDRIGKLP
ncbi:acyl-CoA thioesterase [Microvenator marinus]|uniref:Acyl-CoA thioesterase n=1 Tax=Microvenator marinus TaxID=2600177 RepID=A0A5B8XS93_9DELT|nr:acyl-CoA thioesterase [Microvenator marinus]QED28385.1 acyl-CoA thioesterase [Microvenator marinus]